MSNSGSKPRIEYHIDGSRRRVRAKFYGAVTADQVETYLRELEHNPEYKLDFDALIDLRCYEPTLSRKELQQIALLVRTRSDRSASRRAVLVSDESAEHATHIFEGLTFLSPVVYRSFRSEAAAEEWLAEHHTDPNRGLGKNAPER